MDKYQAIQSFWSSFGLKAYDESTVSTTATLPYITYEAATASFEEGEVPLSANLWYSGKSWDDISKKAAEISNVIGFGGISVKTDTGYIRINRRSPFAQRMRADERVRRIFLAISVDFIDN